MSTFHLNYSVPLLGVITLLSISLRKCVLKNNVQNRHGLSIHRSLCMYRNVKTKTIFPYRCAQFLNFLGQGQGQRTKNLLQLQYNVTFSYILGHFRWRWNSLVYLLALWKLISLTGWLEKYLNHPKFRRDSLETNSLKWEQVENRKRVLNGK